MLIFCWGVFSFGFAAYLVGVSGAFKAPGFFWIFMFPIMVGIFANGKYAILSLIPIMVTIAVYFFFDKSLPVPEKMLDPDYMLRQKVMNSVLFCVLLTSIVYLNHRALRKTRIQLDEKTKQLNTLIQVVCHDLKNEVFVNEFHLQKLLSDEKFDKRRLQKAQKSIQTIKTMMLKVANWSIFSTAAQNGDDDIEAVLIKDAIEDIVQSFEIKIEEKNINIVKNYINPDAKVMMDQMVLKVQIFTNLLSNAIKFTPDGGEIRITTEVVEGDVCIRFTDSGVGISEQIMNELFIIRKRGSTDGTRGEKGTGLGLPLLKDFVDAHHGSVNIFSPPRESISKDENYPGTEIEVSLPATKT